MSLQGGNDRNGDERDKGVGFLNITVFVGSLKLRRDLSSGEGHPRLLLPHTPAA